MSKVSIWMRVGEYSFLRKTFADFYLIPLPLSFFLWHLTIIATLSLKNFIEICAISQFTSLKCMFLHYPPPTPERFFWAI